MECSQPNDDQNTENQLNNETTEVNKKIIK